MLKLKWQQLAIEKITNLKMIWPTLASVGGPLKGWDDWTEINIPQEWPIVDISTISQIRDHILATPPVMSWSLINYQLKCLYGYC